MAAYSQSHFFDKVNLLKKIILNLIAYQEISLGEVIFQDCYFFRGYDVTGLFFNPLKLALDSKYEEKSFLI